MTAVADSVGNSGLLARRAGPALTVLAGLAPISLGVATVWLEGLAWGVPRAHDRPALIGVAMVASIGASVVGTILALRRPRNAVGWLFVLLSLVWMLDGAAAAYANYGLLVRSSPLPGATAVAAIDQTSWMPAFLILILVVLCFPEGSLASRTRRRLAVTATASTTLAVVSQLLAKHTLDSPLERYASPFWISDRLIVTHLIGWFGLFGSLIWSGVDVVRRLRRARGVERRQLAWFAYGALLVPGSLAFCLVAHTILGLSTDAVAVLMSVAILFLPAATLIAILKYRLYAIDRVVNRTLVYGTLTTLLGALYVGLVVGFTHLIGRAMKHPSSVTYALATLLVAGAFLPLRSWVQQAVDKRFARRRFEAVRIVEEFSSRLRRDEAPPEEIGKLLAEALRDPSLLVAFPRVTNDLLLGADGTALSDDRVTGRAVTAVGSGDGPTALLIHDPALAEEPDLLGSVVTAARLPLEIVRLRVQVQAQLEDVRASRARIVAAQDAERRRVERDIHDGAQQRLVGLALKLQLARRKHETGTSLDLGAVLEEAAGELSAAVDELRELARGVYPVALREDGLAQALTMLARRSALPTTVDADVPRLPAGVEAAAYFLALEALTNAVRHSGATAIEVAATARDGHLTVSVSDDGVGGADSGRGSGLAGLADRFAALGGAVLIESPPGSGTRIVGELPCGP